VIKTYRDLLVWQKSMALVTEIYSSLRSLPTDEIYGLSSQIKRSAVSVPSNIAEGYGRGSKNDYTRYLRIARGSLYELQTQLEICVNLNFLAENIVTDMTEKSREIERMLSSLITKVHNSDK